MNVIDCVVGCDLWDYFGKKRVKPTLILTVFQAIAASTSPNHQTNQYSATD